MKQLATLDRTAQTRWAAALATGAAAWLLFLVVGATPVLRASGLALVVVGVTLLLTRWGALVGTLGGLLFAVAPAFWAQTGGAESLDIAVVGAAVAAALVGAALVSMGSRRPVYGLALGLAIFAALFLIFANSPRSLRLTTLLAAWTLVVLHETVLMSNPRPDEQPSSGLRRRHVLGLLLLLTIGILNDPLFVLLVPASALGLALSQRRLPLWAWGALLVMGAYGLTQFWQEYGVSTWWTFPAAVAEANGYRIPFLMADGWRVSARWVGLFALVAAQFTPLGLLLGGFGLARLSRWYPPLGVVTLVAYGTYFVFGLLYFGRDSAVLLLPLIMIQLVWMAYAVHTLWGWLRRRPASLAQ